jgi:hypothetical protein
MSHSKKLESHFYAGRTNILNFKNAQYQSSDNDFNPELLIQKNLKSG